MLIIKWKLHAHFIIHLFVTFSMNYFAGKRIFGQEWEIDLRTLEKFIGLVITRGVVGARNWPVKEMWDTKWGCSVFSQTLGRDRFLEIMKSLRFDIRTERRRNLETDKFCLASTLWNLFIENCKMAYTPNQNLTVDEQLLPCKARCKFIQYIASKPDKFGLKFWLLVDAESKYMFNGFPYLGKKVESEDSSSTPTNVVLKLVSPLFNKGYNVTSDNYFTSLELSQKLSAKKCSLVGTVRSNRREIPAVAKLKQNLHDTQVFSHASGASLTVYQCKRSKSVILLSTLHRDVQIDTSTPKKKPETVLFYNKTKVGVDVVDQMVRMYSVKAASRRWPMHVFYNVIDMALLNGWILFREITGSSISRRKYIQQVADELTGASHSLQNQRHMIDSSSSIPSEPSKQRLTCNTGTCNKNRTTDRCSVCQKPICGKCSVKKCPQC